MKISDNGLTLVMAFEGCLKPVPGRPGHFKPYTCPAGVLTIGWGHTNHHPPRFGPGAVWTQAQCDDALRGDLAAFEQRVQALAKVPLAQHEFDALVSWAFNTGGPARAGLWRALNSGRKAAVPAELAKWNKGGGKVLAGLVRRRKAEGLMFAGEVAAALRVAGARQPPSKPAAKASAAAAQTAAPVPDLARPEPAPKTAGWRAWLSMWSRT